MSGYTGDPGSHWIGYTGDTGERGPMGRVVSKLIYDTLSSYSPHIMWLKLSANASYFLYVCQFAPLSPSVSRLLKFPGGGTIMKEPTWTFDVDYVPQNNRSS